MVMRIRLQMIVVVVMAWLLVGCDKQPPNYSSINLTRANYGRDFVGKVEASLKKTNR